MGKKTWRRRGTRFSDDGKTVFVRLRVDRRSYEYARHWAQFHAGADPHGTAEEQLEGYLNMALMKAMDDEHWQVPPEIQELYPPPCPPAKSDLDDDIPF